MPRRWLIELKRPIATPPTASSGGIDKLALEPGQIDLCAAKASVDLPASRTWSRVCSESRARPGAAQHSPRDRITGHRPLKPARRSKTATRAVRSSSLFSAQLPLRKPTPGYPFCPAAFDIQQATVRPSSRSTDQTGRRIAPPQRPPQGQTAAIRALAPAHADRPV